MPRRKRIIVNVLVAFFGFVIGYFSDVMNEWLLTVHVLVGVLFMIICLMLTLIVRQRFEFIYRRYEIESLRNENDDLLIALGELKKNKKKSNVL